MDNLEEYVVNNNRASSEEVNLSRKRLIIRCLAYFLGSLCVAFFYLWIYTSVFNLELPKTVILKKVNKNWKSEIKLMSDRLVKYDEILSSLQLRDDEVYRSIFGLNAIPSEKRNEGFGGIERYDWLGNGDNSSELKSVYESLDILTKKSYIQSLSFEEIGLLTNKAGDMATSIPAIIPVVPDKGIYRLSSSFGYRRDPFTGRRKYHSGLDFALEVGNSIFATGDGVVELTENAYRGYGKNIIIDHGFGYKTRYAHLSEIYVKKGMEIKRGSVIGLSGNTGRSSGPHLHYEVKYRGNFVNPYNYMDLALEKAKFTEMITDPLD